MFCCLVAESAPAGVLESVARACSPRVAPCGDRAVVFDVKGLLRAIGPPMEIAREVERMSTSHGARVRVAVADTMTAAWVLAHAHPGVTVVCDAIRDALAPLPTTWLATVFDLDKLIRKQVPRTPALSARSALPALSSVEVLDRLSIFERWGIRTCGDLAGLVRADLHARMGPVGVRLHQAAHGEDVLPLVPTDEAAVFADRVELEWPIDGLEPLTFVLARQCERLSVALERADRGAVAIHTTLTLVTRARHERQFSVPAPIRDARVLRTLIGLDLESHPPPAAIDVVEVRLEVTPGRILQGSLLTWAVPTPEDLSTLLARLGALVGDTRVGAPALLDTHDRRPVAVAPFRVQGDRVSSIRAETRSLSVEETRSPSLRRFRLPLAVRVDVEHGTPANVWPSARDLAGGRVISCAGPWRSSGSWWTEDRATWDRDEWDVELTDGVVYRLARNRATGGWEIEGTFD